MKIESMFVKMLPSSSSREVFDSTIIHLFKYVLSTCCESTTDKGRIVFLYAFTLQYKDSMNEQFQYSGTRAPIQVAVLTFTSLSWCMVTIFEHAQQQKLFQQFHLVFKNKN